MTNAEAVELLAKLDVHFEGELRDILPPTWPPDAWCVGCVERFAAECRSTFRRVRAMQARRGRKLSDDQRTMRMRTPTRGRLIRDGCLFANSS